MEIVMTNVEQIRNAQTVVGRNEETPESGKIGIDILYQKNQQNLLFHKCLENIPTPSAMY